MIPDVPAAVLASVRSTSDRPIPHPRQEPTMTTPRPSPAGLSPLLDQLDEARASIGDSPAFRVLGFIQDDENPEQVLARFDDGGTSVFAECYGADAAALIATAVNAVPQLTAAVRAVAELADSYEWQAAESLSLAKERGDTPVGHYLRGQHVSLLVAARSLRAAIAAPAAQAGEGR